MNNQLKQLAKEVSFVYDETEDYIEIYSKSNPFVSLISFFGEHDTTVKCRVDDDDLYYSRDFHDFDSAWKCLMLLDWTTREIAKKVRDQNRNLFGGLMP